MNENLMQQLIAELLDAQEQAFAIVVNSVADVTDRVALATALQQRLATSQAAASHPIRDRLLVLLCHKCSRAFSRRQHGHLGSVLSNAAAIRSRKLVMDDRTWRCVRWAAARLVMRG